MGDTTAFQTLLADLRADAPGAAHALVARAYPRLRVLAGKLLRESFPGIRDVDVDEVVNEAYPPLVVALETVRPATPAAFLGLAAHKLRHTLLNLAAAARRRRPTVPVDPVGLSSGAGIDPGTSTYDPARLAAWTEQHRRVDELPDGPREVFAQRYYLGLTPAEIAEATGLAPRQVNRLWHQALLLLGDPPDAG